MLPATASDNPLEIERTIPMGSAGTPSWASFDGKTLETLMAVFLLRDNIKARMREPSSGDGGVDVYEPFKDGYRVYQIKGFASRVGSNERAQIKKSLATVRSAPRLDKAVREWLLVLPTTFTSAEEAWFKKATGGAQFDCDWRDEAFWISQCSKYPDVVDFYLANGYERLRRNQRSLRELLDDPANELLPVDIRSKLENLRTSINAESPHYRYEFRTAATPPGPPADQNLLVLSHTVGSEAGGFLTWDVYAKFPQATVVEPVGGNFTIKVRDDASSFDIAEAVDDFLGFGVGLDLPLGAISNFEINAPGGLGGKSADAGGRIGPALVAEFKPHQQRLQVEDEVGSVVAEASVDMTSMTRGSKGVELRGSEIGGSFELTFRVLVESELAVGSSIGISYGSMAGKRAVDILEGFRFLAAIAANTTLVVRPEFGPTELARGPVEGGPSNDPSVPQLLRLLEDLSTIQTRTMLPIVVPAALTKEQVLEIRRVAHLIGGNELTGTWTGADVLFEDGVEMPSDGPGAPVGLEEPLTVSIGQAEFALGRSHTILASALRAGDASDGRVHVVPGEASTWVRRFGPLAVQPVDEAPPVPGGESE